jgi:pimeloyl-ACP methyl ester carboxylesterase
MQTWQYPYPTKQLEVQHGVSVAYIDKGTGSETLLFVHGLGSNLKAWTKNIDALSHSYRCIAIDLPGYGRSQKGPYPFSITFFSGVILDFIHKMNLDQITLIGHSMGGHISIAATLKASDRIKKLVLAAPAGFETFNKIEQAWFSMALTPKMIKAFPKKQVIKNIKTTFYRFPEDANFMIEDRLQLIKSANELDYYAKMIPKCIKGMVKEPVYKQLSNIDVPTLVLFGYDDALIPNTILHPRQSTAQIAKKGSQLIPNCQLHLFEKTGHFIQWEQSYLFNSTLVHFLVNLN